MAREDEQTLTRQDRKVGTDIDVVAFAPAREPPTRLPTLSLSPQQRRHYDVRVCRSRRRYRKMRVTVESCHTASNRLIESTTLK